MKHLAITVALISLTVIAGTHFMTDKKVRELKVAYTTPWRTLHPALQHTLIGDLLLSNQFSALVGVNDSGVSIPLAAKSWLISEDFRIFTFTIDRSLSFPDGSKLSAADFKRSWEQALKLKPISANNSLLDILYNIEGFEEFEKTGVLSGVEVLSEDMLRIRFKTPFRMALEHLQGKRFAAFKEKEGKLLGTGEFQIDEVRDGEVVLTPRADLNNICLPRIRATVLEHEKEIESLYSGEIDALPFVTAVSVDLGKVDESKVGAVVGHDALNIALGLNNSAESIFHQQWARQAIQRLLFSDDAELKNALPREPYFSVDPQHFLPLQMGRLEESEVTALISQGGQFTNRLIEHSKRSPIRVLGPKVYLPIIELLKKKGLTLTEDSGEISVEQYIKMSYEPNGPDILIGAYSVASGDPDGLYHALGPNGAIRIPYVYDKKVGAALELGRQIVQQEKIHPHYQNVSRLLLTEVPQIHIGFAKALLLYRKGSVEVDTSILKRNQGQLHFLRSKHD